MAEWQLEVDDAMSRTLASAGLQPRDLDFAAPAGGACEIDGVRNGVSHFSRVLGPSGATTIEDVCARGAARYASMLADASDPVQFRSAQVPAVGLEVAKGSFDRILDINHTRGARSFRIYTPADASSEVMSVKVLQGFARVADSNTPLQPGPFEIALSPADSLVKVEATQIDDLKVRIRLVYGNHTVQKDMELV